MKELSLHILDIVQNSLKAKATIVEIRINENLKNDRLTIEIKDNGKGMSQGLLEKATDPFVTTRKTRRVGLGLSLLKAAAQQCEGDLSIESVEGIGTRVYTTFQYSHIDRVPLGNMVDSLITLLIASEEEDSADPSNKSEDSAAFNYVYEHQINDQTFLFETKEIKKILGNTPINDVYVLDWIKNYLKENLERLVKT